MSYVVDRMSEIAMQDKKYNGDILLFNNLVKNYISDICTGNFDHDLNEVFNSLYKLYRHGYDFRTSNISASSDKLRDLRFLADLTTYNRYLNEDEVKEAGSLINAILIDILRSNEAVNIEVNKFLGSLLKMNYIKE